MRELKLIDIKYTQQSPITESPAEITVTFGEPNFIDQTRYSTDPMDNFNFTFSTSPDYNELAVMVGHLIHHIENRVMCVEGGTVA